MKTTTIKLKQITKEKLVNLNFVKKGHTFDEIVNELIKAYMKRK